MEDTDLEKTISERVAAMPKAIRNFIAEGTWLKNLNSIADQYYLDAEQKESLDTEIMLTIIGLESARELTKNITDNVGLSTDLAEEISSAVGRQILAPLADVWEEAETEAPMQIDPMAEAKNKFARIASKGRFPADTLIKRFEMLPKNVQDLVVGNEIAKIITPLSIKYDLHIDQGGTLAEISILVMLGLVKTTEFIAELERGLGLTKIKAGDLAYEVDQKLFKPIREDLKKAAEAKEAEPVAPLVTNTPPSTNPGQGNPDTNIIHPHPAQRAYYGSVPQSTINPAAPSTSSTPSNTSGQAATESAKITEQKLNNVVSAPKQDIAVKRTIDPYREPIN